MSDLNNCFRIATDDDIEKIHCWLVSQSQRDVYGTFLCNWSWITKAHEEGDVIVCIEKNQPIAYLLADFAILEVREEYRGRGVGRSLVAYGLDQARNLNFYCISGICAPETSISFWRAMGFEFFNKSHNTFAYLMIEKDLPLPKGGELVKVDISFYPESKRRETETKALKVFSPHAIRAADGVIHLGARVAIFLECSIWDEDPVVGICIDGVEVYLEKAKYPEASELGVQLYGETCFIERLTWQSS